MIGAMLVLSSHFDISKQMWRLVTRITSLTISPPFCNYFQVTGHTISLSHMGFYVNHLDHFGTESPC